MSILSVSRRTDIPTYFSEWFLKRLEAGEAYARLNPYNPKAVTHYVFTQKDIDCIVFWTKNPIPMLSKLDRLRDYRYYFQFTLTGYGSNIEGRLPDKADLINAFRDLSSATKMGSRHHVVWRYDPIIFTSQYTPEWHLRCFERMARMLAGFTDRCVISFVDMYGFVSNNMIKNKVYAHEETNHESLLDFCGKLSAIAKEQGIEIFTCAETIDFESVGIQHGSCIDKALIEKLFDISLDVGKDKGQRKACGCVESVDFGKYNTCSNDCKYCYACKKPLEISENLKLYDVDSPILCDNIGPCDIITDKPLRSLICNDTDFANDQLSLF